MKCTHPDHNDKESCKERAVGCHKDCKCCMEKIHMYSSDGRHTEYGSNVYDEIHCILSSIIKKYAKTCYIREIGALMHSATEDVVCDEILLRSKIALIRRKFDE